MSKEIEALENKHFKNLFSNITQTSLEDMPAGCIYARIRFKQFPTDEQLDKVFLEIKDYMVREVEKLKPISFVSQPIHIVKRDGDPVLLLSDGATYEVRVASYPVASSATRNHLTNAPVWEI